MSNVIITIGRQFGSGGRKIGKAIAEKLNIKFYDKELLYLASKESGIGKEFFERADETKAGTFLQAMSMGFNLHSTIPVIDHLSNESLFNIQVEVIKEVAKKESCVIVGRCADYILRESSPLRIFITCDEMTRVEEIEKRKGVDKDEAEKIGRKVDKARASYYSYYTDQDWADARNYDITINSSLLGEEGTVDALVEIINKKCKL